MFFVYVAIALIIFVLVGKFNPFLVQKANRLTDEENAYLAHRQKTREVLAAMSKL